MCLVENAGKEAQRVAEVLCIPRPYRNIQDTDTGNQGVCILPCQHG